MDKNLINILPKVKGFYKENASLSHYTWFKVGGNADILYKPHDAEDLSFFLKNRRPSAALLYWCACAR